jgi:hypothetical protein
MSNLPGTSNAHFLPVLKSRALHPKSSGGTSGIGRAQSLYNHAGDILDS